MPLDSNGKLLFLCQERTSAISFTLGTWELMLQWEEWQFLGCQWHLKGHRKTKPVIDTSSLSAQKMLLVTVRTVLLLKQALQVVSRAFSNTTYSFQMDRANHFRGQLHDQEAVLKLTFHLDRSCFLHLLLLMHADYTFCFLEVNDCILNIL